MKTIEVSNEDYEILIELSKELQTQPNHGQAFPYFWEPASEKLVTNVNGEGEVTKIYYDCDTYSPEDYAENHHELYLEFLNDADHFETHEDALKYDEDNGHEYITDLETEWIEYIECHSNDAVVYSSDWEQSTDHNPSLFLSDVQGYIEGNKHHLGRNPRTYARTIHRMPKMQQLIECIYRLNKQPAEDVNQEAKRFVYLEKK